MRYDIGKYDNSQPSLTFETVDHAITGQSLELPSVRWGDVAFGFANQEDMQDIDTWVHELTEDTIADLIQGQEGVDVCTIAQILGHAHGINVYYDGHEFFAFLHHLLTSLSVGTLIPTLDGFVFLDPDEFWRVLKPIDEPVGKFSEEDDE